MPSSPQAAAPAATPSAATPNFSLPIDNIQQKVNETGIYVSPEIAHMVDANSIAIMLQKAHTPAKVVVLAHMPRDKNTAAELAASLHEDLGLVKTLLIVVSDNPRVIGAAGGRLDDETLGELCSSTVRTFDSEGYAGGVAQMMRLVDVELATRAARLRSLLAAGIGIPLLIGAFYFWAQRKRRLAELVVSRNAVFQLRDKLAPEMEKMEADCEYALIAENDETRRKNLRASRKSAEDDYEEALGLIEKAETADEYDRAQLVLKSAQTHMHWTTVLLDKRRSASAAVVAEELFAAPVHQEPAAEVTTVAEPMENETTLKAAATEPQSEITVDDSGDPAEEVIELEEESAKTDA